ncbi:MAG: choice-of-anchor D domain-containing protein [Terriglobia bacterium]
MKAQYHLDSNHSFSQSVRLCARLAMAAVMVLAIVVPCFAQTVVGTITRPGMVPTAVAVYEAGNKVFVADDNTGNLYMYDGTTLAESGSAHIGTSVLSMVVDETRGKLYAGSLMDKKISVVNASTGALIKVLPGTYTNLTSSQSLVLDPGLGKVYAISFEGLTQIDEATDSETLIPVPGYGGGGKVAVNTATHEIFVCLYLQNVLVIINPVTYAATTLPSMGGLGVCANWRENKVYTAYPLRIYNRSTGSVTALDVNENDATILSYNSTSNRVYSDSEVDGISTIFDGVSDGHFNLPLPGATSALGFRYSTHHVYYAALGLIAVVDETTQMVETIPVNIPPVGGLVTQALAVNQTTGRVYVVNDANALNFVTVVQDTPALTRPPVYTGGFFHTFVLDSATNTATDELRPVGPQGFSLAVRPGGGRIYQPTGSSSSKLNIFAGVNQSSGIASIDTGGTNPVFAAVTPDGSKIYVTNEASNSVGVIDAATYSVLTTVAVGNYPQGIAIGPSGAKAYVANLDDNSVSLIDTASNTVSTTIHVGASPHGVAVNLSGTKLYVTSIGANTVSVINTATNAVIATVPVGGTPYDLAISPDGKRVYVANSDDGTVSVIDTGTDSIIHTVTVGSKPHGIAVLPDGSKLYVTHDTFSQDSALSVINPSDFSVTTVNLPAGSIQMTSLAVADPTSKFAGRVTDGGSPVSGALLRALQGGVEKGRATTNAAGDYSIFNLQAGTYDVEFSASGYTTQTETGEVVGTGRTQLVGFAVQGPGNPVPAITSLSPSSTSAGSTAFTLTVNGSNFVSSSVVRWNGSDRTTTFVSATQLHAAIPASDIVTGGTAQITVFNPSPGGGASNALSFAIAVPVAGLSTVSLSFSSQVVGTTSAAQTVTLSNTGAAALSITSISISSDFGQTNTCSASLAASAQCTFGVTFTPTASGSRSGTLTITDNAAGSPHTVTLSGTGTAPSVILSPTILPFSNQLVGATSAAQAVTLSNNGTASVIISSVAASGDFAQTNTCGTSVAGGANCTIHVTFNPTAPGKRTGTLTITDNAPNTPQTASLSGTGTAVSLSATSLSFGAQLMGTSSLRTVMLTNLGSTPLTISSLTVVSFAPLTALGTKAGDFAIESSSCMAGGSVAGLASCTITVALKPTAAGVRSATLVIRDSDPGSPQTVSLRGTGTAVRLSATFLNFGPQPVDTTSAPKTVMLTNLGNTPLRIESLTLRGRDAGDFAIQSSSTCAVGNMVAGEGRCTINLAFKPSAAGARSATLVIRDSDPSSPQTVSLSADK